MINKFDIAELLLKVALNTISHQPLINKLINFILIHTDICIDIIIKQGQDIYPLTSLIPPHFYICNQPGHKSPLAYEEGFFMFFVIFVSGTFVVDHGLNCMTIVVYTFFS
jgi:hypothetical protein